jgi:hypothetical protein
VTARAAFAGNLVLVLGSALNGALRRHRSEEDA